MSVPATAPPTPPGVEPHRSRRGIYLLVGLLLAAIGAVVALVVLQRSGGGDDAALPVDPAAPPPTAQTEEERIVAAYKSYNKASDEAMGLADADYPLLSIYGTNPHLDALRAYIRELRDNGLAMRTPPNSTGEARVTVLSIDGDGAALTVCSIDDGYMVRGADGQPLGVAAGGELVPIDPAGTQATSLFAVRMVRDFGAWKVSSVNQEQRWEGVAGCAVGS